MNTASPSLPQDSRYILTRVGQEELAFPSSLVAQILILERSQLLPLPFYQPMILGVIHDQGRVVPLLSAYQALFDSTQTEPSLMAEQLTAVYLTAAAEELVGVGLVVDRVAGTLTAEQLSGQKSIRRFQPQDVPAQIWQPRRWIPDQGVV